MGPVVSWIDPDPDALSRLNNSGVAGSESFGLAGAQLGFELDRTDADPVPTSGWNLKADLAAYPTLFGADAFGTASAGGAAYVPLVRDGAHLAFRLRGQIAAGEYPVQFAPAIGGRSTVRGYPWHRFAGDAAVSGGGELRIPVGTVNFLVRSQLGVFGLADVGRVWFDGSSNGGWHSAIGGGIWLSALGRAVSVAYAHSESRPFYINGGRFYIKSGLSY